MFCGRYVIGIVGGIGSGKSYVAGLFGELGCLAIDSDELVRQAYRQEDVKATVRRWWGDAVLAADGQIDRKEIAKRVFGNAPELKKLEDLVHPVVGRLRDELMTQKAAEKRAIVWDTPLLYEVGLDKECDSVVFVDAPLEERQRRVQQSRGWDADELIRREKSQMPLDKKRLRAQYIVYNTADRANIRRQVEAVLSRILTQTPNADPG